MGNQKSINSKSYHRIDMINISNDIIPLSPFHNKVAIFKTHESSFKGKAKLSYTSNIKTADRSKSEEKVGKTIEESIPNTKEFIKFRRGSLLKNNTINLSFINGVMKILSLNKGNGNVSISISAKREPILNKFTKVSREVKTMFGEICLVKRLLDDEVFELYIIRNNFINKLDDFEKQIQTYCKLNNESLCKIIDYSQDLRNLYVVQEFDLNRFIYGVDLHSYILNNSNYTEYIVGKIILKLLNAINCCHKEGLFSSYYNKRNIN